jgi:hypothetical protein
MAPAPAAPLYRITPLTRDKSQVWRESAPIDVPRDHVPLVCQALRRAGVNRARVKLIPEAEDLLPQLAEQRLPALMRRQCA